VKILRYLFLGPLSILYQIPVFVRNKFYDRGLFRSQRLSLPVISVGNLSAGGTGKTPFVISLTQRLVEIGYRPAILTRGYRRESRGQILVSRGEGPLVDARKSGDEPFLMAVKTTGAVIICDKDRYSASRRAAEKFRCDVIVLDDGFQHRRLHRDLDIILWDASRGPQDEWPLPLGRLREPLITIQRAHKIAFTRCKKIPAAAAHYFQARFPEIQQSLAATEIDRIVRVIDEKAVNPEILQNQKILAFCGLGNADQFFDTVRRLRPKSLVMKKFPDHHKYSLATMKALGAEARNSGSAFMICTEKDLSNFPAAFAAPEKLLVLSIRLGLDPDLFNRIRVQIENKLRQG